VGDPQNPIDEQGTDHYHYLYCVKYYQNSTGVLLLHPLGLLLFPLLLILLGTTTTITTIGVTMVTTNTTPVITIDSDTDKGDTTEPDSKQHKMDHSEDIKTI
jgi:hypothetical protein